MGNEKAWKIWGRYFDLCYDNLTQFEYKQYSTKLPKNLIRKLAERCYNEMIGMVITQKSRLAFQVLGYFLLSYGAKMTEDVKILILKNSRWIDDRLQLKQKRDRIERRKYIFDFRERVVRYESGKAVKIPIESVTDVVKQTIKNEGRKIPNIESYIQRTPIIN